MRFWIGPPQWDATFEARKAPDLATAWIDLSSLAQCAVAGPAVQGAILCGTPNAVNLSGSGYTDLGTDPQALLSAAQKSAWQSTFSLPNALVPTADIQAALWETLTIQSDPTGGRCLPLVPNTDLNWVAHFAGVRFGQVRFRIDRPEATPLQDLLRRAYQALRQRVDAGEIPLSLARKVLGGLAQKFNTDYRWFLPASYSNDAPLPPETTISDNFNTADGDTLGPGLTWTEVDGDWDIVSNKAELQTTFGSTSRDARAESDLSSSDHSAQVDTTPGSGTDCGACVRFANAAETFYAGIHRAPGGSRTARIFKVSAGTLTDLGNATISTSGANTMKMEANGSTLNCYQNGSLVVGPITDTAITSGTRTGIFGYNPTGSAAKPSVDNFSATDLAVAVLHTLALLGVGI